MLTHDASNSHASLKATRKSNVFISSSDHVASCIDSHNSSSFATDSVHTKSTSPLPIEPLLPSHPLVPLRTHLMATHSQNNIFEPKQVYVTTKHPLPLSDEPSCVFQALKGS